jgi:hypothetical protein
LPLEHGPEPAGAAVDTLHPSLHARSRPTTNNCSASGRNFRSFISTRCSSRESAERCTNTATNRAKRSSAGKGRPTISISSAACVVMCSLMMANSRSSLRAK